MIKQGIINSVNYWNIGGFSEGVKEAVLRRDSYHCYICENDKELEVHHVLPRRLGGNHELDNLVTLCKRCHRHIETGNVTHAISKCFENAKKHYGLKTYKEKVRLSKIEQLSYFYNEMESLYKKLVESNTEEIEEVLTNFDSLFDELEDLKKIIK
ncbi:HNH endonuclease [Caldalkalibacillus mannanilyticus]|uniref:HNH endonuclease n=1 Tax=Caldalkalibacillus mannanilyticus TaxID=1418 RepID=UPI00046986B4|nr:HNH endonuclease [Caldalkalibacillus mannanilyticus]